MIGEIIIDKKGCYYKIMDAYTINNNRYYLLIDEKKEFIIINQIDIKRYKLE